MYPLKFEPFLRPMIWGGEKIAAYKGVETSVRSIGESWELSGVAGHESIVAEGPCKGVSLPELIDRYGDPPPSVSDLVNVSLVRVQASAVGVTEVTQKKDTLTLQLESLELPMIRGLLVAFNGRVTAGAGNRPYLSVTLQPDEKPLELLQSILKAMAEILNGGEKAKDSK